METIRLLIILLVGISAALVMTVISRNRIFSILSSPRAVRSLLWMKKTPGWHHLSAGMEAVCDRMGWGPLPERTHPSAFLLTIAGSYIIGHLILGGVGGGISSAILLLLTLLLTGRKHVVARLRSTRAALPDLIRSLSAMIGSGASLERALAVVSARAPAPLASGLERASIELSYGALQEEVLDRLVSTYPELDLSYSRSHCKSARRPAHPLTGSSSAWQRSWVRSLNWKAHWT